MILKFISIILIQIAEWFLNFYNSRTTSIKSFANCVKPLLFRCKPFLSNMFFSMFTLMIVSVFNCCSCGITSSTTLDAFLLSCLFIGVEIIVLQLGSFYWMNSFILNIFEIMSFYWWSTASLVPPCRMT